jgi:Zn-dependent peptidase ImmA (M78 family)
MLSDHKVRPRTALEIKQIAKYIRSKLCGDGVSGVRAAGAIRQLTNEVKVSGEFLKLELRNSNKIGAPAVVSYRPLKLEFDKIVWAKALLSRDVGANYIAAHELGHIVMHNHDAQPFSGLKQNYIDFEELSAEWQANRFADCFLVTDREIDNYISPDVLAQVCMVSLDIAERRFLDVAGPAETCCPDCYGTKVYRLRSDHFCWTCRKSFM